jgi:hypothetical protein
MFQFSDITNISHLLASGFDFLKNRILSAKLDVDVFEALVIGSGKESLGEPTKNEL